MVMYVRNYVDRNALPQARVQGLEEDLKLSGYEYNIVLSLTFIGSRSLCSLGRDDFGSLLPGSTAYQFKRGVARIDKSEGKPHMAVPIAYRRMRKTIGICFYRTVSCP
jgi:hypothetical protein